MDSAEQHEGERDERMEALRRRIAAYEQCVEAVGVLTVSLEELSAKIELMKTSAQQLNAFTSGWLANACHMTERQPWDSSTRLRPQRARREEARGAQRDTRRARHRRHEQRCSSPECRRNGAAEARQPDADADADPARAMIEKAVDSAVAWAMQDEGRPTPQSPVAESATLVRTLREADAEAELWRERYGRGRQQRQREDLEAADRDARLASARLQYEQRKLALRSLRAQVEREIESLRATSQDLTRRESLMDEAFERYERYLVERGAQEHQNARAG